MGVDTSPRNHGLAPFSWVERFLQLSPDLLLTIDEQGFVSCVSPSVKDALGYTASEVIGRQFPELVVVDDREQVRKSLTYSAEAPQNAKLEFRGIHRDGHHVWLQGSIARSPVDGLSFLACRDITQQRLAVDELEDWKQRYEIAMTLAGNIVYEWNIQTDEVLWGGDYEGILGYSEPELSQSTTQWLELVHPDDRSVVEAAIDARMQERSEAPVEYRLRHRDGTYRRLCDNAVFVRCNDDPRFVGVLTDVTTAHRDEVTARHIVDRAPLAMLVAASNGEILTANPSACQLLGYSLAQMQSVSLQDILPQLFVRVSQQDKTQTVSDLGIRETPEQFGIPLKLPNGRTIPADVGVAELDFSRRKALFFTVVDLSRRVAAERALQDNEKLLQQIIDNSPAVIYVKDANGRYELVNRQFLEIFGRRAEDVLGNSDFHLFDRDRAVEFRTNDELVLKEGRTIPFEEVAEHLDGLHHYISVKFPLQDNSGAVRAIAGISTDISELTRARNALESATHRLELILQSVTDGIFGLDSAGRITFTNDAALELLGFAREEVLGVGIQQITRHSRRDGTPCDQHHCPAYQSIVSGQSAHSNNDLFHRKDGTPIPVDLRSSPIIDGHQVVGAVVTFRNMTAEYRHRRSQEELATARSVQGKLYPNKAPIIDGYDIYGSVLPATQACGDYFDFIQTGDCRLLIAVGDVAGHGLGPALQMVETRAILHSLVTRETRLAESIRLLNQQLCADLPEGSFVSLFVAELDPCARRLTYVGAGHAAIVIHNDGSVEELHSTGLLLGLMPEQEYGERELDLDHPCDLLAILTDGIQEAMSPGFEMFGPERVIRCLSDSQDRPCEEISSRLIADAMKFSRHTQNDDMTMVLVKAL